MKNAGVAFEFLQMRYRHGRYQGTCDMPSSDTGYTVRCIGAFNASRAAFEQLKKTKGSIIYISAGQAFMPYAYQLHVGAAKAGIDNMMKNLALEWGKHGIRCNSIAPGPIEGTEGMRKLSSPEATKQLVNAIPLRRMGTVDDIGQAAVFLASPLATYISGTLLVVDGGQNLPGSALFNMGAEQMMQAIAGK